MHENPPLVPDMWHVNPGDVLPFHFIKISSNVILPHATTSYRRSFRNLSPTYWCLGEASGDGQQHGRMRGKDCAYRLMHHVWCPPPIYAVLCTESVKTDEEGEKRQVAWERRDTGTDPTQWLCPHEKQPTVIMRPTWHMYFTV